MRAMRVPTNVPTDVPTDVGYGRGYAHEVRRFLEAVLASLAGDAAAEVLASADWIDGRARRSSTPSQPGPEGPAAGGPTAHLA